MKRILLLLDLALCLQFTTARADVLAVASADGDNGNKTTRSYVGTTATQILDINEDRIKNLNLLASKFYHDEKFEDAVRIGEKCLDMIRAYQGIYNELYHNQLVNQATYLYALDRYPDCMVCENKALNIAERLRMPAELERLQLMSETADELGERKTPADWKTSQRIIYDECIAQPNFIPADIAEFNACHKRYADLEAEGREEGDEGMELLRRMVPLALSLGETREALEYVSIVGNRGIERNGAYTMDNAQLLLQFAMALVQGYAMGVDLEEASILDAKYVANGVMEALDSCGVGDHELRVKALMARSYSFSHTGIMGNAYNDAEEAVGMAERLTGSDSELYDYALYYFTQVSIRRNGIDDQILDTLKQIYRWRTKHYGAEHSMTISALLALAHFSAENGAYDEAENLFNLYFKVQNSFIESCFAMMSPEQQARFWGMYSHAYHRAIPEMEIQRLASTGRNSAGSEVAFNSQLLSKGMKMYVQSRSDVHDLSITWRDVQRSLKKGDIAVEFVRYHYSEPQKTRYFEEGKVYSIDTYVEEADVYAAIVVSKDSKQPEVIRLFDTNEIGFLYFNNELRQEYLSQKLWQPIAEKFPTASRIFFSPDGELYNLPVESLPYYKGDGLMSDHFPMLRLTSTRELVMPHRANNGSQGMLVGGVDYESAAATAGGHRGADVDVPYLPGTESEVLAISDVMTASRSSGTPVELYMHKEATENVIKSHNFKNDAIMHIATHGFYFSTSDSVYLGTPLQRSGLLMAGAANMLFETDELDEVDDGILTSEEISHLDFSHLNIVTLSACDTARGDLTGDGVEGLQLGFKLAGANSILMSLWKVDDEATCKLMTEFYSNWITRKMTKHDALEAAKKTVRETPGWEEPKYWAAFILLDGLD